MKREYGGRYRVSLSDVLNKAVDIMGKDKAYNWWLKPNDQLDELSPYKYCCEKSASRLLSALEKMECI